MNVDDAMVRLYQILMQAVNKAGHPELHTVFAENVDITNGCVLFELYKTFLLPYHFELFKNGAAKDAAVFQQNLQERYALLHKKQLKPLAHSLLTEHKAAVESLLANDTFMTQLQKVLGLAFRTYQSIGSVE